MHSKLGVVSLSEFERWIVPFLPPYRFWCYLLSSAAFSDRVQIAHFREMHTIYFYLKIEFEPWPQQPLSCLIHGLGRKRE